MVLPDRLVVLQGKNITRGSTIGSTTNKLQYFCIEIVVLKVSARALINVSIRNYTVCNTVLFLAS